LAHFAGGLEELPSIFRTVRGQSVYVFQLNSSSHRGIAKKISFKDRAISGIGFFKAPHVSRSGDLNCDEIAWTLAEGAP